MGFERVWLREKLKGVIFDLDGVVLETQDGYWKAWQEAGSSMGYDFPESLREVLDGHDGVEVRRAFQEYGGPGFEWTEFAQRSGRIWYRDASEYGIPVKKGVWGLISLLKRKSIPYCLATNSYKDNALACLGFAGISGMFDLINTRDEVKNGKPAPDLFLLGASRLGVAIDRCLVLEDSMAGVKAAIAAGSFAVHLPSEFGIVSGARKLADWECEDLGEVSEVLGEILGVD